ncbi:glycosyltransferase [Butyrivibrio sp. CB08]|uniref:glycosyltransferase n=1 Tax=Butyrivibrio sp. CB08 TaxID=2364879 RepID=UPI000EA8AE1B|nr:glycosyltransferase [Butyrivibrio sp. CB08]RKM57894.1 glycosyltransferase [Butyrivibrio sp. CB08]
MRVCHVTSVHPRHDIRICEKECVSLSEYGFDVFLVVNDPEADEEYRGVHIISTGEKYKGRIDRIIKAPKCVLRKALEVDADIYHLHDPELLSIALKLKRYGKTVVFDSHEFTAVQIEYKPYIPEFLRKPVSDMYKLYEARILRKLDGMVEPCTYNGKDFFGKIGIPKVIIGNYPKRGHFDEISRGDIDFNKCCYVGGITAIRGIFHMIKGCYLAGKRLVLIGSIDADLKEKIESMPEYDCVEYMGVLPHDEAMKEVAKCGMGLSLLEPVAQYVNIDNLPTKVYEYMMMGMPVVLSNFPFYNRIIEKYAFGLTVDSTDDQSVAKAIIELAADKDRMKKMGEEGKRAIKEEMSWELDAEKLVSFYKTILGE